MEVLFPPTGGQSFRDVQTYLINNPQAPVTGATFAVKWADIDQGPGVNPQYDWTSVDTEIQPWTQAGKKANLVLWAVSDSVSNTATPQYVWNSLGASHIITCTGEQIPDYFDVANFQTPYLAFIGAALQKYGSDPAIGYIRVGLGRGGETFPGTGFNGADPNCTAAFINLGFTHQNWINYLTGMMSQVASMNSSKKQLMVGIVGGGPDPVPAALAQAVVPEGIGFGSQGLKASDQANYPSCTADWCNLFNQYAGQVPLELQTVGPSCPAGTGQCPSNLDASATGSLVPLIPWAATHKVDILELYHQDWLIAYDPNYPGNSQYGAAYATAIQAAASGK
jgi:hypothetical protein